MLTLAALAHASGATVEMEWCTSPTPEVCSSGVWALSVAGQPGRPLIHPSSALPAHSSSSFYGKPRLQVLRRIRADIPHWSGYDYPLSDFLARFALPPGSMAVALISFL